MDSEERAFLTAIIAEPDENLHRLVYADWLEEKGQDHRAARIRRYVASGAKFVHPVRALGERAFYGIPEWFGADWRVCIDRGIVAFIVLPGNEWGSFGNRVLEECPVGEVFLTTEPDWAPLEAHVIWKGMTHPDRTGETFTCDTFPGVLFHLPPSEGEDS